MGGIKTIQLIVNATTDVHNVTVGTVTQGCDSKAALLKTIMARRGPSPRKEHFDLASSILNSRSRQIKVQPKWVRGHQDSGFLNQYLDQMALLNIRCDELAKTARIAAQACRPPGNTRLSGESWPIFINRNKVSHRPHSALRQAINGPPLLKHWIERGRFTREQTFTLD